MDYFAISNLVSIVFHHKSLQIQYLKQTECVYLQNLIDSNKMKKLAIIIPAYKARFLQETLDSIAKQKQPLSLPYTLVMTQVPTH